MLVLPSRTRLLVACVIFAVPCISQAQTEPATNPSPAVAASAHEASIYDSAENANRATSARFSSPEDDARPGEYFFGLAVRAVKKKDYPFAVSMYKVAASWAYKPAEYNLGVMYARGIGMQQDLPRAMAWLSLAAERNDKAYVAARDLINSKLSDAQFKQADTIFGELKPTYGDASALVRAKARWAQVRAAKTGSRVGSLAGNLKIGTSNSGGFNPGAATNPFRVDISAGDILGGNQIDGAIAYRQLVSSDNPYDPKFAWHPGHQTVTVGPLNQTDKAGAKNKAKPAVEPQNPPASDSNTH